MSSHLPKVVETHHYHLWTDALHARSLARQAKNRWDRGTYVRWTVTTAWTVLEIACQDSLNDTSISYRFREYLDKAIRNGGFPELDWGSGVWQRVTALQAQRKSYLHRFLEEVDLFPDSVVAGDAICVARDAVLEIYRHVGRPAPGWIHDNEDRGWDTGKASNAALTGIHAGASWEDPESIHVKYVHGDKVSTASVLPNGTDFMPYVQDVIANAKVPISRVRVYQGEQLIHEQEVRMRGT